MQDTYSKYLRRSVLTTCALISTIGAIFAQNVETPSATEPVAVFDIPKSYDPDYSLNSNEANGLTPYYLYSNPAYAGDIIKQIFSDFTGNGYVTYNYGGKEFKDADGTIYYPLWLLGFDNSGGDITFKFSPDFISEHGVNINKVIIRGAQNRFSTNDLKVVVNGLDKLLPYTPNAGNLSKYPSSQSSMDLEFDFPQAQAVESVTVSCESYGMGFTRIEFYTGEPQELPLAIDFWCLDETGIETLAYVAEKETPLQTFQLKGDGICKLPEPGYKYAYTISSAKGEKLAEVEGVYGQESSYQFPAEGRYLISVKTEDDQEGAYTLELYPRFEDLSFVGCGVFDSILNIQDFMGDENDPDHEVRDLSCAKLFDLPEGVELYYYLWNDDTSTDTSDTENSGSIEFALMAAEETDDIPEGYTLYDPESGVNLIDNNNIDTIIRKNGVTSPKQSLKYTFTNVATGVKVIESNVVVKTRLYSIDGRNVSSASKGLIISISDDGKVEKRFVK